MKQSLTNSATRNFYFIGEGDPTAIFENKTINYSDRVLTVNETMQLLGTSRLINTNAHNFRFVFLDACNSGLSSSWARAFGIPVWNTDDLGLYTRNRLRPGAFLGWTIKKRWGTIWDEDPVSGDILSAIIEVGFVNYRVNLIARWTGYYGIIPAWPLDYTVRLADGFQDEYSTGYIIYGYKNLGWNEYNDVYW